MTVAGDSVTFTVDVANNGDAATDGVTTKRADFYVDDVFVVSSTGYSGVIAAGGTHTLTADAAWIATAGSHRLSVIVDPLHAVPDVDYTNNDTWVDFIVDNPPVLTACDLTVEDLTWAPPAPQPGDQVVFTARVRNIGGAAYPGSPDLRVDFRVAGALIAYSTLSTAIAAGALLDVTSDVVLPQSGTYGPAIEVETALPFSAPVGGARSIAFYGDSLTDFSTAFAGHGYIPNGLGTALAAAGFTPRDLYGCGGMQLAQFVGSVATNPANSCQAPNTLSAHTTAIRTADIVVVAFITNDYARSSAQRRADAQSAVTQIKALNPSVEHIVFIHNYAGSGAGDGDLDYVAANNTKVTVMDVSAAYGGSYSVNCADSGNANATLKTHPTNACSVQIINYLVPLLAALA